MALSSMAQREEIFNLLKRTEVKAVVLVGESGIGKSWTAREIGKLAIREEFVDVIRWVFLSREYGRDDLLKEIARQLCVLPSDEEWDGDDGDELTERKKEKENKEESIQDLQLKISQTLKGNRFLLILDDLRNKEDEQIMSILESFLEFIPETRCKILITSKMRIIPDSMTESLREVQVQRLQPLSPTESMSLLQQKTGMMIYEVPGIKTLAEAFNKKTNRLPAAVVTMAKALSHLAQREQEELLQECDFGEAFSGYESYDITRLLCTEYNMLPLGVLMDCCWSGSHFFRSRGSMHFNELIAYWMLEGYLGRVDCIEKAYEKGHHVLMELIDCHILKKVETSYVTLEGSRMNLEDCHHSGYVGTACLGLATVFGDKWEGLGRITQAAGMMQTLRTVLKGHKVRTLLLDGNCLGREVPDDFFRNKKDLQVLAVFNPTFKSLPSSLCCMDKLFVLVLRDCEFLAEIDHPLTLQSLTVLEISGASSFQKPENKPEFFNDLFKHMPRLQSLNLSSLPVDSLPSSLYDLSELCSLILRGCSRLTELKSLGKLSKLVLLDASGATSLKDIPNLDKNPKLETLNLSHTKITKLPILAKLGELCHLSLNGCEFLTRIPSIISLASLQTIDLSGAKKFLEFHRLTKPVGLTLLDLSETAVLSLPPQITNLRHLFLKRCSKLKVLSCTEALKELEVLDLSGTSTLENIKYVEHLSSLQIFNLSETSIVSLPSTVNLGNLRVLDLSKCSALTELQDQSFDHFSRIQKLDLSGTKITRVPSLSNCSNLRELLLERCTSLEELPQLESLSKLEKLNLSGISVLRKDGADFLKHMTCLRFLDLSETMLQELPSMSKLKNLKQLILRGCSDIKTVPNLDVLTKLEVLDLSGTAVVSLPSFASFSKLRQLMLKDCSCLEEFQDIELLHLLLGETVKELPYGISKLAHLEQLDLPNMKVTIEGDEGRNTVCPQKDQNRCEWIISSLPSKNPMDSCKSPLSVSGSQFLQVLERKRSLWDTAFTRFHFCASPVVNEKVELPPNNTGVLDCIYRNENIFGDVHFQTTEFLPFKERRTLKLSGFMQFPKGIEPVLGHADCLFLTDNIFEKWLSDLVASNLKVMKACWIERCTKMENVFHAEEAEYAAKVGEILEILGVSGAFRLKSICSESMQYEVFQNLTCLYLDCCPMLSAVFLSAQTPAKLKVLEIKFCDNLKSVFADESTECRLPNLETLHLWELPELESIGCKLPQLGDLQVWACPKLEEPKENVSEAGLLHIPVLL